MRSVLCEKLITAEESRVKLYGIDEFTKAFEALIKQEMRMIKNIKLKAFFGACALVLCLAAAGLAQKAPKVGGYRIVSVEDQPVIEAAEFAVATQGEKVNVDILLDTILKAEQQTVAGMNFRLCLAASVDGGELTEYRVIVYRNLKNVMKLTSWKEQACSE